MRDIQVNPKKKSSRFQPSAGHPSGSEKCLYFEAQNVNSHAVGGILPDNREKKRTERQILGQLPDRRALYAEQLGV